MAINPKTLLARLVALVAGGNAEVRELWLDVYPEDATPAENKNRAFHDRIRKEEKIAAAKALAELTAASAPPVPPVITD